jgi:hypothetical protein
MAEARSEEEVAATSHQLDAFHQTFNFCLTCRQYTCGECWNIAEGRCLTCAPLPGQEEAVSPIELGAFASEALEPAPSDNGHVPEDVGVEAWPEMDLPADRLARVLDLAPEPPALEPEAAADVAAVVDIESAAVAAEALRSEAEEPVPEAFDAVSEPTLIGVAPGQSLDDAIAEYEARIAAEEAALAAEEARAAEQAQAAEEAALAAEEARAAVGAVVDEEPTAAEVEAWGATAEPEVAEPEVAEPEAAEPEAAEPEPVAAAPAEPEPVAAPPVSFDHVQQPTWPVPPPPVVQAPPPAAAPSPTPSPWLTVAPDDNAPQWPTAPQWPVATARRDGPMALSGRPFLPQADASALWAASNQEVLGAAPAPLPGSAAAPQAQPCVSCGLSLSANARFCRRCGTRQG